MGSATAAVVAIAAPPHSPNVTGRRIMRTVPRSRIVARRASYSSRGFDISVTRRQAAADILPVGATGTNLVVRYGRGVQFGATSVEVVKWLHALGFTVT